MPSSSSNHNGKSVEPWLDAYRRSLIARREPLLYLLVSRVEAQCVAEGVVPKRLQVQAQTLLTNPTS